MVFHHRTSLLLHVDEYYSSYFPLLWISSKWLKRNGTRTLSGCIGTARRFIFSCIFVR